MESSRDKSLSIGVVGTGVMGSAFSRNLLGKGYAVHVFNRTPEKVQPLVSMGAIAHKTVRELAENVRRSLDFFDYEKAVSSLALGLVVSAASMLEGTARARL